MIVSFRCRETEKIFNGQFSRKFAAIQRVALRKLTFLDAAETLAALAGTGNSLEALKRDRIGQYAFRINDRYRICFRWEDGKASDAEIVDYHQEKTMPKSLNPPPVHPGEILLEDFMRPAGISINQLARDLRVPVTRISEIVNQRRSITGDTALRLGRYFSNTAEIWMNLQRNYDLRLARVQHEKQVELDVRPRTAA